MTFLSPLKLMMHQSNVRLTLGMVQSSLKTVLSSTKMMHYSSVRTPMTFGGSGVPLHSSMGSKTMSSMNPIALNHNLLTPQFWTSMVQQQHFHSCLFLLRRGLFHPSTPKKRRTVAGVRKRFKVTGSGKLQRRGIGNSHLAWRKQSRRKRRLKHKKWVTVESKSYTKNIVKYLGKRNFI